jgi:ubiquinol-cytochrome c reductase iron-sulfur subunit
MLKSLLRPVAALRPQVAKFQQIGMASRAASTSADKAGMGSVDNLINDARLPAGDHDSKRAFTYFVLGSARFLYASAARVVVIRALAHMSASADVLALANLEVDLSKIPSGTTTTVKWRGKPVFIRHRTDAQVEEERAVPTSELKDPQVDDDRVSNPEWLVVMGVCTHLGCVPIADAGDYNGWYCPCHGSHYDGSGRIRRGPAPLNLEVPPYKFLGEDVLVLG